MFEQMYRCRKCLTLFFSDYSERFDGSDEALADVKNGARLEGSEESYAPIAHECEQGGFGIADYIGVGLAG